MSRKNRQLSNAFGNLGNNANNQEETTIQQPVQENEKDDVTMNSNTNPVEELETENTLQEATETPVSTVQEKNEVTPILAGEQVLNAFLDKYEAKVKKPTVEDTHTRATFLFRNDLAKRLDKLAKGKRGFKTEFLNTAIEALLNEMEKK